MGSKDTQFKKGNGGGPGRPRGSKNKITELYLDILRKDIAEHGEEVLERVRKEQPAVYIKLPASLVPRDLDVKYSGDITVQVVNYEDD